MLQAALTGRYWFDFKVVMPVSQTRSSVVQSCTLGIEVIPLVGPISIMLALAASGLNGQNFAFVGHLPQDAEQRIKTHQRARNLVASKHDQTQLLLGHPYRNAALLKVLLQTLESPHHLSSFKG
ncbi:MAG: hypothetical protein IPI14_05545 [Polaromonas sp.]|nr:hypothetical protein [Polaromonas sp.]